MMFKKTLVELKNRRRSYWGPPTYSDLQNVIKRVRSGEFDAVLDELARALAYRRSLGK